MNSIKQKYTLFSLAMVLILSMGSCTKWLDVKPSNQISDEDLFSEVSGARNALNGIYQQISDQTLFGRNYTWGLYSAMGHDYLMGDIHAELQYAANPQYLNHGHAQVISLRERIWSTSYNVIANCNKLINEVEKIDIEKFPLGESEKNLILGEAKGVRALLHFELLRLFAPAPKSAPSATLIPYVDTYPAKYTPQMPTSQVVDKIINDLKQAQTLVAQNDTVVNRTVMSVRLQSLLTGSNTPNGGLFFNFRMHRLNYVAISALLARAYHYAGDQTNALEASRYVYQNFSANGRLTWFLFTSEGNTLGANKYTKLADDVIFATYDPDLISKTEAYVGTYYRFRINQNVGNWFPPGRDYRFNLLSQDALAPADYVSDKWRFSASTAQWRPQQNTMAPVLRMSEMYLIYAETLYESGAVTDALLVLNRLRNARGRNTTFTATDRESFYNELFAEYRREYLTEGQTVFAHKRLGRNIVIGSQVIPIDARFTLPIPDGENIF